MWGFGGRNYWGRKERGRKVEGIVVVFGWMSSQEKHLKNYVDLYSSLSWNSLVCQSQFLNMFFPDKAVSLAVDIVRELVEELKLRPCPVVFASFSGGPKACMYKVLQIIERNCEEQIYMDEFQLVRDCISGFIFDSSPVDFTSDLGTKFVLHPTILKMSSPPPGVSWIAKGIASSLDALYLSRFEMQRAEYWQTLYATVKLGAPYLILCSEDDDLAPYPVIRNFAQRLQELKGDVELVKWSSSSHVGHYKQYPSEYKAAVTDLLKKASIIYSKCIRELEGEKMGLDEGHEEISEPFCNLRKAATSSQQNSQRMALEINDHFFVPSSVEYHEGRDVGPLQDEHRERLIPVSSLPRMNANGVLGQFLFDVCVPKNVENWDAGLSPSSERICFRKHSHFNPIKCILRSRL